ncbi:hypothetical protein [Roseinatronobacter bogoriensis]|uniref:hypothetical protein n=1 Tax=Roseinatronobacter bogoriensis TaxID=119542 RepID=UPI0008F8681B|nr:MULTISPECIES: hypothetical protein [Rhodobaca]MBB4207102.1 leucyl-tRNA synthetase [Rhodobaca bogoriensis DSM 18756]TDW35968.1 hypothetical protein LY39_02945 [Rhodobaca barguzinensis]TDY73981.1 hypothetical protein EV660_10112 [Rhodobaca bogoriensis DSM 18756]
MKLRIKTPEDITAEAQAEARAAQRAEARTYLSETDWLVVRQAETGTPIPGVIRQNRAEARILLNASNDDLS